MHKKQVIQIADTIRTLPNQTPVEKAYFEGVICTFADMLQRGNPLFKRERFIGYIRGENGPNGGKP